jgi:hypothetical protein
MKGYETILGNCEYTFNGKPSLKEIRELEDELVKGFKEEYGDSQYIHVVVVNLVPLGY